MFGSFESHFFTFDSPNKDVVVAHCLRSNLSDEENIEAIGHEIATLIEKYDCLQLVMDLEVVVYMTSAMVGKLIRAHRQLHRDGGMFVLCSLSEGVTDVLKTSRLLTYFNIADDVDSAVAQFSELSERDTDTEP